MSLGDRAARATAITLTVQLGRAALQFASTIVLARLLVPDDFGLVAMVTAVVGIADLVRDLGLSMAVARARSISHQERTNLFWTNLLVGFLCAVIALACTPLIVAGYGEPRLTTIVPVFAGLVLVGGFNAQYRADLVRTMRFKAIGASDLIAQFVGFVAAVVLAAMGAGLWAIVVQQVIFIVLSTIINVISVRWWPSWPQRGVSIRHFVRFGSGVFGTHLIIFLTRNLDNVAIGALVGPGALGLYSRAYQLMLMPMAQINTPMTQVVVPTLARVHEDREVLLRYLLKAQQVACYATATVFAAAAGLAEPIIDVLFGPQWHGVVPIFVILAIGGVPQAISPIGYWLYLATGASGALFRQRLVTGLLTIALILAGVPWGVIGVSIGVAVSGLLSWPISVGYACRVTGIPAAPLIGNAVRIVGSVGLPCGLLAFAAGRLPIASIWQLLLGLALGAGYLALAHAVVPAIRRDMDDVWSIARRSVRRGKSGVGPDAGPDEATIDGFDS